MSQTSTLPQTRTAVSRSSSILLTPSKRRKLDDKPKQQVPKTNGRNVLQPAPEDAKRTEQPQPTPTEILRWTFTKAAITPCFVRDVFEMTPSGMRGKIQSLTVSAFCLTFVSQRHGVFLAGPNSLSHRSPSWSPGRSDGLGEAHRLYDR